MGAGWSELFGDNSFYIFTFALMPGENSEYRGQKLEYASVGLYFSDFTCSVLQLCAHAARALTK